MSNGKKNSRLILCFSVIFILITIIFELNFLNMNRDYRSAEQDYMIQMEDQIKTIIDGNSTTMAQDLKDFTSTGALELSVANQEEVIFSSLPYQKNMLGHLNKNAVLMESQGTYKGHHVWFAIYHMPDATFLFPFFIKQGIIFGVLLLILVLVLTLMRKSMITPLETIKKSVESLKEYKFEQVKSGDDVINQDIKEFSSDLDANLQTVSRQYTKLETALQIERDRLKNSISVSRSFIHDMKSPIHLNLLENEFYIKDLENPDEDTTRLAQLNISQSQSVLNTINDVLNIMKNEAFMDEENSETFDVVASFMQSLKKFNPMFRKRKLTVNLETDGVIEAKLNKSSYYLLVHNLLSNLGNYASQKTPIEITITENENIISMAFLNYSSQENIERMTNRDNLFKLINDDNEFSGGNGMFLIEDLCNIMNGTFYLDAKEGKVKIIITLPKGYSHE